ncbi:MAG: twin-arginine translocation signal domain-containing protein [Actinobacteria bacterium]|nr:twin-arginine translocation signal domain-containing protein [Actinomycetota bacterium]
MNRRDFVKLSAGAIGLSAAGALRLPPPRGSTLAALPASGVGAPFDHVVLLMMENRSFDHLLGWLPGANGRQSGLSYVDTSGARYPTYALPPDFQGCGYADPDHSFKGGLTHLAGGQGDGFLKTTTPGDTFPIGYYGEQARPVMAALARSYTVCDNYFCAVLGETFPNRVYQQAGRTDRDANTFDTSVLPTIWDGLAAAGYEGRDYFHDLATLGLWGQKYMSLYRPFSAFENDVANGDLASYTIIDPAALGEGLGVSNDDHPHADLRAGDELFSKIYHALRNGPKWNKTLFIINYDEWGGFYDHVIPPRASADDSVVPGSKFDFHQRGFRVPCLVISPFAPARVAHEGPFDHASVLKLVEWRFGLPAVAARDAAARNLAEVLDFSAPRVDRPAVPVLIGQPRIACGPTSTAAAPPKPIGAAADTTTTSTSVAAGTTGATIPTTGLDLPILQVGTGVLVGAWGLYHLLRTGDTGPLPLRPPIEPEPETPDAA